MSTLEITQTIVAAEVTEERVELGLQQRVVETLEIGRQGPAGPQGPPGEALASVQVIAGQTISALRAVRASPAGVVYASSGDLDAGAVLGVSLTSGNAGQPINVQTSGALEDSTWNWIAGWRVFLGLAGALTHVPAPNGAHISIGVAITATKLLVRLEDAIVLGG
jgi:hypothetical protein